MYFYIIFLFMTLYSYVRRMCLGITDEKRCGVMLVFGRTYFLHSTLKTLCSALSRFIKIVMFDASKLYCLEEKKIAKFRHSFVVKY